MDHFTDYEGAPSCVCCDGEVSADGEAVCGPCSLDGWRWCAACKRTYMGHGEEEYGFCEDCTGRLRQLADEELEECPF